jgi:hypothetical protein
VAGEDHQHLWTRFLAIAEYLTDAFSFVDESGEPVHERRWLESLRGAHG